MRPLLLILLLTLNLVSDAVLALQMPVYEGEVALEPGEREDSERALRLALLQVLVKVSGDRSIAGDAALGDARRMALSIGVKAPRMQGGASTLVANFDPGRVHDLVAALGRPVWHGDRPALL